MGVVVAREDRPEGGHVVRLTIDNAAKLNTLNRALMVEIVEAIERLEADSALRLDSSAPCRESTPIRSNRVSLV